uniref:Protein MEMO1 n=1 Tax=Aceria tosichella TaxID=561515 RepID=A0A6G1SF44_9ACAR
MSSRRTIVRRAKKADSWYEAKQEILDQQLTNWLNRAGSPEFAPAKAIISPHAGYQHCGSCAAYAYKEIDPMTTSRIFILGPSHHVRINGIALSPASIYQTPLGDLTVDRQVYDELFATNLFEEMTLQTDEEEHSLELQLPFIKKIMSKRQEPYTIVPMMVGSIRPEKEMSYGKVLAKYLAQPENVFIISSDFCHWGQRFDYQFYDRSWGKIFQSIERLDKLGMKAIKDLKLDSFTSYLKIYGNTICGRHPIGVLIAAVEHLNGESDNDQEKPRYLIKFLNYLQSSKCHHMYDSSVSYVAATLKQFTASQAPQSVSDIVDVVA